LRAVWLANRQVHAVYSLPPGTVAHQLHFTDPTDPKYLSVVYDIGNTAGSRWTSPRGILGSDDLLAGETYIVALTYAPRSGCPSWHLGQGPNVCRHQRWSNTVKVRGAGNPTSVNLGTLIASGQESGGPGTGASVEGTIRHPTSITVRINAIPNQGVAVAYNIGCSKGPQSKSAGGNYTDATPVSRDVAIPIFGADSCTVTISAGLDDGGFISVKIYGSNH
jgi:hypothetical protein